MPLGKHGVKAGASGFSGGWEGTGTTVASCQMALGIPSSGSFLGREVGQYPRTSEGTVQELITLCFPGAQWAEG
jgi:hypothetical protein